MRGKTLTEKAYGPGFRDRLLVHAVRVLPRCAVEGCSDRCEVIVTLYVDAHPPGRDWYAVLLRSIPIGAETEVGLCPGHGRDVIERDDDYMGNPDLWEPGRENPPVMPGPGRFTNG